MQQEVLNGSQQICKLGKLKRSKTVGFNYFDKGQKLAGFLIYENGEIYAYKNSCPHVGVELNWQPDQFLSLDGFSIQCSLHGAQFRIEDGFCHSGPCLGKSLKVIKVAICGENVIICTSDKKK